MKHPLRHVSLRVPWHDSGWTGIVCQAPHLNGACAKLKRIAGRKRDAEERAIAAGTTRYPDFIIEEEISGRTIYWEHLGLLHQDDYRRAWEVKHRWYQTNGVLPYEAGGGPNGSLVETRDEDNGSLDSMKIAQIVRTAFHA